MKRLIYLCCLSALMACKPMEKVVYVPEVRVVNINTTMLDTVFKAPIEQSSQERVTSDTTSTLNNKYATSTATVSGGVLTHTLETLPDAEVEVEASIPERTITIVDSIPYPVPVPEPVPVPGPTVYIEKQLKWWQRSLMWIGGISILSVAACVGIKIYRWIRRPFS